MFETDLKLIGDVRGNPGPFALNFVRPNLYLPCLTFALDPFALINFCPGSVRLFFLDIPYMNFYGE